MGLVDDHLDEDQLAVERAVEGEHLVRVRVRVRG